MKSLLIRCTWLGSLALGALPLMAGEGKSQAMRTWTDATGKHAVVAELLEATGEAVRLKKEDGTVVTVPIARLSEGDRRYLASLQKAKPQSKDPRPAPPPEVERVLKAMEASRQWEIERLEAALKALKRERAQAIKDNILAQAKVLADEIKPRQDRINTLRSGKAVIPRLRRGMSTEVGQIGYLEENADNGPSIPGSPFTAAGHYVFSVAEVIDDQTMVVSTIQVYRMFVTHPTKFMGKAVVVEGKSITHVPDLDFKVLGLPTAGLKDKKADPGKPSLLTGLSDQVFEVVANERRGTRFMSVLKPFDISPVNEWLKKEGRPPLLK
jgi:hypothetical protein